MQVVGKTSYISFSNVSVTGFRATGFGSVTKALCELISRSFSLFVAMRETALRIWTFPFIGTRSHIVCARVSGLPQAESIRRLEKGFAMLWILPGITNYPCEGHSCNYSSTYPGKYLQSRRSIRACLDTKTWGDLRIAMLSTQGEQYRLSAPVAQLHNFYVP